MPAVVEIVKSDKIQKIGKESYVDNSKFYKVTLQIGAQASYKNYAGRKRRVENTGSSIVHNHEPAIHITEPISGNEVNGLISTHNAWVDRWMKRHVHGTLDRQILVLNWEPTNDVPKRLSGPNNVGMVPLAMVEAYVRDIVKNQSDSKGGK